MWSLFVELLAGPSTGLNDGKAEADGMAVRARIRVGVDVGKAGHHACAVDDTGKVVFSQKALNGQAAPQTIV